MDLIFVACFSGLRSLSIEQDIKRDDSFSVFRIYFEFFYQ